MEMVQNGRRACTSLGREAIGGTEERLALGTRQGGHRGQGLKEYGLIALARGPQGLLNPVHRSRPQMTKRDNGAPGNNQQHLLLLLGMEVSFEARGGGGGWTEREVRPGR